MIGHILKVITSNVMSALVLSMLGPAAFGQSKPVQIAMSKTFFVDKSKAIADIAGDDFKVVLKKATGLDGQLDTKSSAFEIAAKLEAKEVQFGLFFAHELGWVQKKYPDIQPLLIAVHKDHPERVHIIVHKNNPAKSFADLAGKKLDIPAGTFEPSRLVLDRLSAAAGKKTPAMFFGSIVKSSAQAMALDGVARGTADATVVESTGLDFYKDVKGPVFEKNLRVLYESMVFPPAVIAYKKGGVEETTLKRFRDGLVKAHTIPQGRDLMKTWKIDGLELATDVYAKRVAELLKTYPAP